jgi:DNA helicase-2/ATP-dependent DNA helicase PcrA
VPALTPGDRVNHDKFGLGTVVSTDGYGDSAEAKIDFGSLGIKHLVLRYAPLEKL